MIATLPIYRLRILDHPDVTDSVIVAGYQSPAKRLFFVEADSNPEGRFRCHHLWEVLDGDRITSGGTLSHIGALRLFGNPPGQAWGPETNRSLRISSEDLEELLARSYRWTDPEVFFDETERPSRGRKSA